MGRSPVCQTGACELATAPQLRRRIDPHLSTSAWIYAPDILHEPRFSAIIMGGAAVGFGRR